jgi:Concanavalin A-like lectin/glucanases superfamily
MRRRNLVATLVAASGIAAIGWAPSPAYAATVVALWHMDDKGSTMTDSSGNGLTGHLKNVAVGQPGLLGTSFGWTKTPAYVTVPDSPLLDPGTGPFTVTLHVNTTVKPPSSVGDYDVIRKGLSTSAGGDYKIEILKNGAANCLFRGSTGQVELSKGPNIVDGTWHTVSCSRSSNTVTLMVDGVAYKKSGSIGNVTNTAALSIGAKDTRGNDQYNGLIDEVSISN